MKKVYELDDQNKTTSGLLNDDVQELQEPPKQKEINYYRPNPYPHLYNRECAYDVVCHENDCKILQKLVCQECAKFVHPMHKTESLDWYFNHQREKIKRKEGMQQNIMREINELTKLRRNTSLKYYKYIIKAIKKCESETRAIEDFTESKLKRKLGSTSRKEAFEQLVKLIKRVNHPKLQQLKQRHSEFNIKEEYTQNLNDNELQRKELYNNISEIIDSLFMADERERFKMQSSRRSPSPQREIRNLRNASGQQERKLHRLCGAAKRFQKRMLSESRMVICNNPQKQKITIIDVDLTTQNDVDQQQQAPRILQILPINKDTLLTVHPNEIRLWKYDPKTYSDFKPIAPLPFNKLKYVCVADLQNEFVVLFDFCSILAISSQNLTSRNKQFLMPKQDMNLFRIALSGCQNLLIASGGCSANNFYILIWSYRDANLKKVIKHQYQFPNEGDLLISYTNQHIFRCSRNLVDVYGIIEGIRKQQIQLQNIRDSIEQATILERFGEQDSLCVTTNRGFFVYTYDEDVKENNYKLVYNYEQSGHCIHHVFYQSGLAEEGFLLAVLESNETDIKFTNLNGKLMLKGIQFSDQVLCGKLDYQRNPWINQLHLLLGFESGMLRVLKFIKQ